MSYLFSGSTDWFRVPRSQNSTQSSKAYKEPARLRLCALDCNLLPLRIPLGSRPMIQKQCHQAMICAFFMPTPAAPFLVLVEGALDPEENPAQEKAII